jgi:hypothetical protein
VDGGRRRGWGVERLRAGLIALGAILGAQEVAAQTHPMPGTPDPVAGSAASAFAGATVGTDVQPSVLPMEGVHAEVGEWSIMAHGFATLVSRWEPTPRGVRGLFSTSMGMAHARRRVGGGWLEVQAMASAEPTSGPSGYPLLLQTGETADGVTPLVDRQHPHDFLMALAASYRVEIDVDVWTYLYAGPVGSPALGPVAFMHRASGDMNPVAPITHHFLDATHISYGVVTAGLYNDLLRIEGSWFNGHEPDERRWRPDPIALNSYSARLTLTPSDRWAVQASHGHLDEPEQLHPGVDVYRTTASATYVHPLGRGRWATMAAWGRNLRKRIIVGPPETPVAVVALQPAYPLELAPHPISDGAGAYVSPQRVQNAYLLETALTLRGTTVFGRWEGALKDELFPPADVRHGWLYSVSKVDVGVEHEVPLGDALGLTLGASATLYGLADGLESAYGEDPRAWTLFARLGT